MSDVSLRNPATVSTLNGIRLAIIPSSTDVWTLSRAFGFRISLFCNDIPMDCTITKLCSRESE